MNQRPPLSDASREIVDHAMRVLWTLVERAGGTITVTDREASSLNGAFHVSWEDGSITVSIAQDAGERKQ